MVRMTIEMPEDTFSAMDQDPDQFAREMRFLSMLHVRLFWETMLI